MIDATVQKRNPAVWLDRWATQYPKLTNRGEEHPDETLIFAAPRLAP